MNTMSPNRPGSGVTRRVWDLADEITRETGRPAQRKEVIERFVAEGGNANTASTQYHYWKSGCAPAADAARINFGPVRLNVGQDGRVVIPVDFRKAMQLEDGGVVTAEVVNRELRLVPVRAAIERLQSLLRPLKSEGESVVDEFLAERRTLWGDDE